MADKGTLFLDEVGDIPAALHPELLRVLQEQEFERLGSGRTHKVNVRPVAATNRNLAAVISSSLSANHSRIQPVSALVCIFQIAVRFWTVPADIEQLGCRADL
jgi:Sigma-54 interaction domain